LVTVTLRDWFTVFDPASVEVAIISTGEFPVGAFEALEIVSVTATVGPAAAPIELLGKKLQLSPAGALHDKAIVPLAGNEPRKLSCIVIGVEFAPSATLTAAGVGVPKLKSTTFRVKGVLRESPPPDPPRLKL
jgi:hypothetical protein